jgi:predicted AAA+ superfamily ATPase
VVPLPPLGPPAEAPRVTELSALELRNTHPSGYGAKSPRITELVISSARMAPFLSTVVERRLRSVIHRRMATEPVIILQGARAVGKSTLLAALATDTFREIVDLDDLPTRDAVRADPNLFVRGDPPVFIDEFQHVPDVLDAIKAELNRDSRPGRFVITGSTRYGTLPAAAQALTGRAHVLEIRPLSQGEIGEVREDFAEVLLRHPASLVGAPTTELRSGYVRRTVVGGFPMPLRRERAADRARWFDDYVQLVLERDVLELTKVRQRQQLPRLLRQLASQTGQVLNIASAASALRMDKSTAENYAKLLEAVFLVQQLPAWGTTLGSRVGAAPKVHMVDPGLAARLLRLTESKLAAASASALTEFGHLLETFVVGEMCKQLDRLDSPTIRGHWRTNDGDEIDLVVERDDGRVVALEVKAGSRVRSEDLSGLLKLRRRLGDQFLGGVVLYTGTRSYSNESDIHVVPVERLWRSGQPDRELGTNPSRARA